METKLFEKLLLTTAFCCMASDGNIDKREINIIQVLCDKSPLFEEFDFQESINFLVSDINKKGKEFILNYLKSLNESSLSEPEELTLIGFAIQTINADEQIEYSEIKFFKNIRYRLKVSDENILAVYPDIEQYLEQDIVSESFLDRITNQYFESAELPQFELVNIDASTLDNFKEDE